MRFRTIAIASALAAGLVSTTFAFAPHKGGDATITAAGTHQPRLHRAIGHTAPPNVKLGSLAGWHQIWDRDTDVPLRMWGPSLAYFASTADAATAASAATDFLAAHIAVLAPGAAASDFVIIGNQLDPSGTIRSVGFQQYANGLRVEGGTIGITFERDHLVMVSSTALPHVAVRMPPAALAHAPAEQGARAFLAGDNIATHVRSHGDRVIVPMIYERGSKRTTEIAYRVAETVQVEADRGAGRWDVWVDANDGAAIARKSLVHYELSGTVDFDVPDRYPLGTRHPQPAPQDTHTINGVAVTSDLTGSVGFAAPDPATVVPGLSGPLVAMSNKQGALVTDTLSLVSGGAITWSHAADPQADAQLDTFVFASQAKAFVRARLNPNLAWLDHQLSATVNEDQDQCNAYSTGDDIHFYKETPGTCENTGRIADVVYHEFGHSVHNNSLIPGQGQFDGSLSEGLADTLAVSMTGDHGMGRGFFFTDQALRDVDPVGVEKKWPDDADGEPHDEGEIIGEALYDLRKALQTKYGDDAGFTKFLALYYGVMQRASDIPSSYAAVLVADDDNGNIADGVPDQCAIDSTFALHGLADTAAAFNFKPPTRTNNTVTLSFSTPANGNPDCPPPTVSGVTLSWKLQGGATATDIPLTGSGTTYSGDLPAQAPGSVVLYHVTVALSDGTKVAFPDNKADPDYQMYVGTVTPIQCFDFEGGFGDWTHTATPASRDEWEVGPPMGLGGDPAAAHGGTNVLGIDLSTDGFYRGGTKESATSPAIDLMGYTNVHLQYYRWLNSEDAAYDQAFITANGTKVFENFASPGMPTNEVNFTDKEWRFADVDLSGVATAAAGAPITITFEQDSDRGLELGGWTVDDVCIVALADANPALCGNGTVDPGEACDDGNTTAGDGCSATCQTETIACPDSSHECDGAGCCSSSRDPSGPIVLSLLTVGLVIRRRRAARAA